MCLAAVRPCVSVSADVTPTCLAAVHVCQLVLMSLPHVSSCCPCVSVSADVTPTCLAAVLVCLLVLMSPPHV